MNTAKYFKQHLYILSPSIISMVVELPSNETEGSKEFADTENLSSPSSLSSSSMKTVRHIMDDRLAANVRV